MKWMLIFFGLVSSVATANDRFVFDNESQAQQFSQLTKELRCMVCTHQSLAESSAPLAMDMKAIVYHKVKLGQKDNEIINFLIERYGDAIVFNPPVKFKTYLLWFGPFLFFLVILRVLFKLMVKVPQI